MSTNRILPEGFPENWLSAYLDGELTDDQRQRIEQAVGNNPQLRELLEELQAARQLVQRLPDTPAQYAPIDVAALTAVDSLGLTALADLEDGIADQPTETKAEGSRPTPSHDRTSGSLDATIPLESPPEPTGNSDGSATWDGTEDAPSLPIDRASVDFRRRRWLPRLVVAASLVGVALLAGNWFTSQRELVVSMSETNSTAQFAVESAESSTTRLTIPADDLATRQALPSDESRQQTWSAEMDLAATPPAQSATLYDQAAGSTFHMPDGAVPNHEVAGDAIAQFNPSSAEALARQVQQEDLLESPAPADAGRSTAQVGQLVAEEDEAKSLGLALKSKPSQLAEGGVSAEAGSRTEPARPLAGLAQSGADGAYGSPGSRAGLPSLNRAARADTNYAAEQPDDVRLHSVTDGLHRSTGAGVPDPPPVNVALTEARRSRWYRSGSWSEAAAVGQLRSHPVLAPVRRWLFPELPEDSATESVTPAPVPIAILRVNEGQQLQLEQVLASLQLSPAWSPGQSGASSILLLSGEEVESILEGLSAGAQPQVFWVTPSVDVVMSRQAILVLNSD